MNRRLLAAILAPPFLVLAGTIGYRLVEGWCFFDSLYMSVITLTTVGFGEVHPLSTAGRAFTIVLALGGVFTIFFAATEVIRFTIGGDLRGILGRKRMEKAITSLRQHIVVCGYGRMGRLVCEEFSRRGIPFVVLERRPEALTDFSLPHGYPMQADATSDDALRAAGIQHARAVVTVVANDADNLFITMSARLLADRVSIVARSEDDSTTRKLERAGATRVVSPYSIGGARVAQAVLRPAVVDFIELATRGEHLELQIEEILLVAGSSLVGQELEGGRLPEEPQTILVAVKRQAGHMEFNPRQRIRVEPGDTLIVLGPREALDRVEALARPPQV